MVAQVVKNPPAMWETWVQYLGWEDPLEKGTATHSSILAWRIPWTEEPGRLQSMGSQSWTQLSDFKKKKEKELELLVVVNCGQVNKWGAWWATVYGVAQSWTQLK